MKSEKFWILMVFAAVGLWALIRNGMPDNPSGKILIVILIVIYFLPTLVAERRGHRNRAPIWILNLFFGWTVIGWVGCLAWALTYQEQTNQGGTNA